MTLIVDGNNVASMAFFGYPPFVNRNGQDSRVSYGLLDMLRNMLGILSSYYPLDRTKSNINVVIVWDSQAPEFRKQYLPQYKSKPPSNDKDKTNDLERRDAIRSGIEWIFGETQRLFNLCLMKFPGTEGDDLVSICTKQIIDNPKVIVSTDTDYYQLLSDTVVQYNHRNERLVKFEDIGLTNRQVLEAKILAGDSSDNLPGVKGIGEKIAKELIQDFGSIQEILWYSGMQESRSHKRAKQIIAVAESTDYINRAYYVVSLDFSPSIPGAWEYCYHTLHNYQSSTVNNNTIHQWLFANQWTKPLIGFQDWVRPFSWINTQPFKLIG